MIGGFFCVKTKKSPTLTSSRGKLKGKKTKRTVSVKGKKGKKVKTLRKRLNISGGASKTKKYNCTSKCKCSKCRPGCKKCAKGCKCTICHRRKSMKGGATLKRDLSDTVGRGSYPATSKGTDDCSGTHHQMATM